MIAQTHIRIAIAIAGMKLDWELLLCGYFEGYMKQILDKRLMGEAQLSSIHGLGASFFKGCYRRVFLPYSNIQASTIGSDTFQSAIALRTRATHLVRETSNDLIKITMLNDQALHQRFQPEQFSRPAPSDCAHLLRRVAYVQRRITSIKDERIDISRMDQPAEQRLRIETTSRGDHRLFCSLTAIESCHLPQQPQIIDRIGHMHRSKNRMGCFSKIAPKLQYAHLLRSQNRMTVVIHNRQFGQIKHATSPFLFLSSSIQDITDRTKISSTHLLWQGFNFYRPDQNTLCRLHPRPEIHLGYAGHDQDQGRLVGSVQKTSLALLHHGHARRDVSSLCQGADGTKTKIGTGGEANAFRKDVNHVCLPAQSARMQRLSLPTLRALPPEQASRQHPMHRQASPIRHYRLDE